MVAGSLRTFSREEIFGSLGSDVSIGFVELDFMFPGSVNNLLGKADLLLGH